jgi:hypothetical protein
MYYPEYFCSIFGCSSPVVFSMRSRPSTIPNQRKDAKSAKERGVEKAQRGDRAGNSLRIPSPASDSFEAIGTPTRLPRELECRSDQGRHPADGQWVIVQFSRILRALGVFAVNLPTDLRHDRPRLRSPGREGSVATSVLSHSRAGRASPTVCACRVRHGPHHPFGSSSNRCKRSPSGAGKRAGQVESIRPTPIKSRM